MGEEAHGSMAMLHMPEQHSRSTICTANMNQVMLKNEEVGEKTEIGELCEMRRWVL